MGEPLNPPLPHLQASLLCFDHMSILRVAIWCFLYCNEEKVLCVHLRFIVAESVISETAIFHSGVIAQKVNECGYNCALC